MAPGGGQVGGGSSGEEDKDAKHMFDRIGKDVYDQVKKDTNAFRDDLKGSLTSSPFFDGETASSLNPCTLVVEYRSKANDGGTKSDPCKKDGKGNDVDRFSDKDGAECGNSKIHGNSKGGTGTEVGACAPYRRLHLCDHNLETISNYDSTKAKHKLLAEVCYAAKHEGESISLYYPKYEAQYASSGSGSTICTMLARSFADIGDIVRGKDLFIGYNEKDRNEKKQLQQNLKDIFAKIHSEVTTNGKKSAEAKDRYKDTENYFQLREDWWDANRETVWEALTCDAEGSYFHATCDSGDGKGQYQANKQCRCPNSTNIDQVPTYFDYVPQYLRWFEEWAEDFCRKKKHKLNDAIQKCRGEDKSGKERYCDLNGYDCEKTKRGRNIYRWDYKCTGCFRSCSHFRTWIDNQKEQFLKQRNKYETEISGGDGRKKRSINGDKYKGYDKEFYKILKEDYGKVENFLEKLSKEKICQDSPKIEKQTASSVDFTKSDLHDIFSHTEYCQACPWCGVKKQNGTWERKEDMNQCPPINLYKPKPQAKGTPINFLYSGDETNEIAEKLKKFCLTHSGNSVVGSSSARGNGAGRDKNGGSDSQDLYQKWTCYEFEELVKDKVGEVDDDDEDYDNDVEKGGGLCILKKKKEKSDAKSQKEPHEIQKTFNPFFYYWVVHMLKDSIHWRTKKLVKCLKNGNTIKCTDKCKRDCGCFEKWVGQKKKEWTQIKDHFRKQKNIDNVGGPIKLSHDAVLQQVLNKDLLLESLREAYGNAEDIKRIEALLNDEEAAGGVVGGASGGKDNTTIDKLLKHEEQEAEKCKKCKPPEEDKDVGRSLNPRSPDTKKNEPEDDDSDDDDEDEDEDDEEVDEDDDKGDDQETTVNGEELPPEEPKKDEICENGSVNCNKHEAYSTSKCKTKTNLIGLEAHFYKGGVDYPNVYISPRVQQLCLQDLQNLKENNTEKNALIDALNKCAYNEAKGLYEYYKKNKAILGINDSQLSEKEIEKYILKAMERSYADYGSIVKGDILCDYKDKKNIDPKIINFVKHHNTSTTKTSVSKSDDEDSKRQKLWESIRTNVWKAMLCGYKDAGGSFDNHDVQCKLPDTEKTNQLFRWFIEWGENFCIRREQELKQLKEICEKGICNGTDETKKKECKMLCESYKQFLSNSKTQYENQKKEYEDLKYTIPEFMKKDALTFLNEKCNSKCLCFETKDKTDVHKLFKYPSDDVKDKCPCEPAKAPDDPFKDLNECPDENNKYCNKYSTVPCNRKNKEYFLNDWDTTYLLQRTTVNSGVLVPPRRSHICFPNIIGIKPRINSKIHFKEHILNAAGAEAKYLSIKYGNDDNSLLVAMKYSFADIGNIIKGDDMLDDIRSIKIKDIIKRVNRNITEDSKKLDGKKWWEENRDHVWNVMVCHYKKNNNTCPSHNDIDKEDQFLRWLVEWGRQVCKEKKEQKSYVYEKCKDKNPKTDTVCKKAVSNYNNWNTIVKHAYDGLNKKYKNFKLSKLDSTLTKENADEYIKEKCSECQCSFKDIDETFKKTLDTNDDVLDVIINKSHIPPHLEDIFNRYNGPYLRCPDSTLCRPYKNIPCFGNEHDDDGDWNSSLVRYNKTTNWGVLLPPRRIHLCLRIDAEQIDHLRSEIENFKNFICSSAFSEAKRLKKVYKDDNDKLLQAMKYSFADIGSIVKGEDMKEGTASDNITKIFNGSKYSGTDRKTWWDLNKYHVWESMLCGYKEAQGDTKTSENCRFPDIETVPQFLRWFQEWTEIFCTRKNELEKEAQEQCKNVTCNNDTGKTNSKCTEACKNYSNFILIKKKEYQSLNSQYDMNYKETKAEKKESPEYFKDKCNGECSCLSEYFKDETRWKNPYESIADKALKGKCNCKKVEPKTPKVEPTKPAVPEEKKPEVEPLPSDEPFDPTILQTTIPFGVALALGSIAFLFLKKKTQAPVDLFSVINIPKGDYDIPTLKSSNRYIPYASDRHKGKTYIYMEGDTSGDEKYAFMSDTTNVTSSESEYEELDINDIYAPRAPKYKTLIEVVLEPSKRDIQSDDTPSNKFTDNEWNQLKKDFISNMLQGEPNDVPNDYRSGDIPLNTQPNTLYFDKSEERPFITSIHDRNLYSGEEISYNVNMVNSMNDIPMSGKNDVYSGIDLINDSLNSDQHIDIYDEVLKRKENELFGTNHTKKNTSSNSVAKNTNSDPILNQINLFHKWLDRHRYMCAKLKNKEDILNKLKEEWNKENNNNVDKTYNSDNKPSHNHVLNTDVSIQIDMDNLKPKNEFTNMDTNPDKSTMDTILDDLEKYNEPYYYDFYKDDIYYDVNDDDKTSMDNNNNLVDKNNPVDSNNSTYNHRNPADINKNFVDKNNQNQHPIEKPTKIQIEMNINNGELVKEKYPISDIWNI
ncbi:erythrocyte membrane protein 1 [Plasmodium falciparum RAJ116]|uniref:Erythrocyte membrane protein 1 n=1 Tax=Plasmodium falciparum RAJ116 TaxID=580058 RepID=A0A0L0CTL3_PLAFA|nr:erythrocyte membrane protein 1 [Plasmodium falciparum RAJ116]